MSNSLLVCGHIDITFEQYQKYYYDHVQRYIDLGSTIYVGGASGTDSYVIEQCLGHCSLVIYDKNYNSKIYDRFSGIPGVIYVCGFNSYPERDDALVKKLSPDSHVYCALYDTSRSLGSGSFHNVLNFKFGLEFANKFQEHVRASTDDWEKIFPEVVDIAKEYLVIRN